MNLNIDDFGGKSVVPVFCGNCVSGTAFFVSPTRLLTAGHVISEYYLDKETTVAVIVEGDYKICRVLFHCAEPDVAVLECVEYHSSNILRLLNCKFKKDVEAMIVGYPVELGNSEEYFGVKVKNSRERDNLKDGYDRMVVRIDNFDLYSYEGFSGAPVINDFGLVMGIETDQLYNTLGYVSVKALKPHIEKHINVKIEENEYLYDNTPYGLWTSRNHILNHTGNMLKTRYNEKIHIEDKKAESIIQSFCGYNFEERRDTIHGLFVSWNAKLAGQRKNHVAEVQAITQYLQNGLITDTVIDEIEDLLNERDRNLKLPSDYYNELSGIYRMMMSWARDRKLYTEHQFLYVSGVAGCGKSHLLYHLSKRMTESVNIYMFLGSEFSSLEDPVSTIARIMDWKARDPLEALNKEVEANGERKATIIIDALNEGAGTEFWTERILSLKEKIMHYKQLKLIVSLRDISREDQLNDILRDGWQHVQLTGFIDKGQAIKEYFHSYNIDADVALYMKIEGFKNPLFLRLFCETYYSLSKEDRKIVSPIPIYKRYLWKRNAEVSHGVDEDPKQNVAARYVMWVALQSLEQYQCEDMHRQQAYLKALRVCPYRTWQKNLLKNCLDANLLREYATENGDFVDFEYDSMGDYLKAECLLNRKCGDSSRFQTVLKLFDMMEENYHNKRNWQKQFNFIRAFLSLWNPPAAIWQEAAFIKGKLTSILLSSLQYRNVRDDENTLTSDIIEEIIQQNQDYIDPKFILQNLTLYSHDLMVQIHKKLLLMTMAERDLFWTTKVNGLFDGAVYMEIIRSLSPTLLPEIEALLTIEIWMFSSSYPYLRYYMIRRVKDILTKNPQEVLPMIEKFHSVDDPYILEGLYAAIYGAMVNEYDPDLRHETAQQIYVYHYGECGKAPQDLMVRYWTLKIFELAHHQDPTIDVWKKVQIPYKVTNDIFAKMPDEDYEADDYFGDTYGGKRITESLFRKDFSRYIIGTNGGYVSHVFFKNGQPVELKNIERAIAFLIKHQIEWNDELGKYDSGVPYQSRFENTMERIGKKYQWIGLYRVYAYLCDTCQMKIGLLSSNERFAKCNYPWYIPWICSFDPTLTDIDIAVQRSHELFDVISTESTMQIPPKEWLQDKKKMPTLYFIINDHQDAEWIILHAYCTVTEESEESRREQFVFYNGFFVGNKDFCRLRKWAAKENFYGRWMPEDRGATDYRWNEYPWSDSYRQLAYTGNSGYTEGDVHMCLAYSAQLQEDFKGMSEENQYLTTAYMPCKDMMSDMCWHTAERGIIRNEQGEIVAINRVIPDDPLQALLVRRDQLDKYLKKKRMALFWCLLGEKQCGTYPRDLSISRLSGAAVYMPNKDIEIVQQLNSVPFGES